MKPVKLYSFGYVQFDVGFRSATPCVKEHLLDIVYEKCEKLNGEAEIFTQKEVNRL